MKVLAVLMIGAGAWLIWYETSSSPHAHKATGQGPVVHAQSQLSTIGGTGG